MSKFIKKILNFQKRKNGNISILVLIMSMAIILLTTAMVGYIFHDIGFTELDKGELRALHFAESGLSYIYYKIDSGDLPDPPELLYGDVPDTADPEGSFTVEYEIKPQEEGMLGEVYTITSTGVDISSGVKRKVKVEITYINIDGFVCGRASGAAQLSGQITITGPFFVDYSDIFLGNASFKKGPLYVNGNITMSGNSSIGEETEYLHEDGEIYGPIILVLSGLFNGEPFDPLNPPDNVYLSKYYYVEDIDVTLPTIDESYINSVVASESGALVIGSPSKNSNLFIGDGVIMVDGQPPPAEVENYLRFNSSNVLVISGNIVVYGYIEIGTKKDTIEYSGNANLISTGGITIRAKVRPEDMEYFPSRDLMALISQNNIDLYAKGGNYEEPDVAAMLIANIVETQSTNTFLRGGTVSNSLVLGENTEIYYQTGIGEYLTAGIPGFGENIKLVTEWQEE